MLQGLCLSRADSQANWTPWLMKPPVFKGGCRHKEQTVRRVCGNYLSSQVKYNHLNLQSTREMELSTLTSAFLDLSGGTRKRVLLLHPLCVTILPRLQAQMEA